MPRRIAEYPHTFYTWNYIASIGALISTFATLIFLVVLFDAFWYKLQLLPMGEYINQLLILLPSKLYATPKGFDAIYAIRWYLEKHDLTELCMNIAVKRPTFLLPLVGLPTHHSKVVAFQTPASPIMEGI